MANIALVEAAQRGDREALVQLIMEQQADYYRLAYAFTRNREDALDAMEDMIVILLENIPRLQKKSAFASWSRTILVNCCKNIGRKRKKLIPLAEAPEAAGGDNWPQRDGAIDLEGQLRRLPENYQTVLRLRYFLDMDYQTIADTVKIPLGTVKSRIATGLKKLQQVMGVKDSEGD